MKRQQEGNLTKPWKGEQRKGERKSTGVMLFKKRKQNWNFRKNIIGKRKRGRNFWKTRTDERRMEERSFWEPKLLKEACHEWKAGTVLSPLILLLQGLQSFWCCRRNAILHWAQGFIFNRDDKDSGYPVSAPRCMGLWEKQAFKATGGLITILNLKSSELSFG